MRVIYIAGAAHSGSTLLDLMLNAHPDIVSVGEVLKLNRQLAYRDPERKTYAALFVRCAVAVAVQVLVGRRCRDPKGGAGSPFRSSTFSTSGESDPRRAPNVILFKAIAAVSGKNFIVDSSKMPRRLNHLMQFPELEIYPVHLVRDPKGQIASVMRKHGGFLKNIVRYEIVQEQIRRSLKSVPHSVVRYEDLVRDPERTLNSILQPLGLSFDRRQLSWAEADKHIVAGNHMRYETTSKPRAGREVEEALDREAAAHRRSRHDRARAASCRATGSIGGDDRRDLARYFHRRVSFTAHAFRAAHLNRRLRLVLAFAWGLSRSACACRRWSAISSPALPSARSPRASSPIRTSPISSPKSASSS